MTNRLFLETIAFLPGILLAATSQAAVGNFSGKYEVLRGDCSQGLILYTGNRNVRVDADESGLRVGEVFYTGPGPDSHTYFESAFEFSTGTVKVHALGDGYELYVGSYSPDGNHFKDVQMYASTDTSKPVYAGEYDFKLQGDQLEIDVTANGQPHPAPLTVCLLKRLP